MNSILAALLGGAGSGASTYGNLRVREQDQERQNAQRMAELQQQEQMRLQQIQEAQRLRQMERDQINADMTTAMRAMGLEVPQGVTLTPQTTPLITAQQAQKRDADRVQRERQGAYNALKQRGVPVGDQFDPNTDYATVFKDYGREDSQANSRDMQSTAIAARAAADAARAAAALSRQPHPPADTRRPLPASVGRELGEVGDVYALIRDARSAMDAPEAKNATGLRYGITKALLPASLETRASSMWDNGAGDTVRARLGNLWSTIGKLRSGGAITDAEFGRLQPFLPSDGDSYEKNVTKLTELERAYRDILDRKLSIYGETYQVPALDAITGQRGAAGPRQAPPPAGGARPPLSNFVRPPR